MLNSPQGRDLRPALRLVDFDNLPPGDDASGGLSPRMTLSEFYSNWFLPIVLEGDARNAGTILSYKESINWWGVITNDPPLQMIDEYTIAAFKKGLRESTYTRGKLGRKRLLSAYTIAKHLRQVRAVLKRVGPTTNPDRPGKCLIDEVPHLRVEKPKRQSPKRCFTLAEARSMVAAVHTFPTPRFPHGRAIDWPKWWRSVLLTMYYTGLRLGTILELRRSMIERRGEQTWLVIPGAITKTGKAVEKFLHPTPARAIDELGSGDQIYRWPYWRRHFANRHFYLQRHAGIAPTRQLSPHAWRRTHATEMAKVGAMYGRRIAQHSLDHEDAETTDEFYVNIEAELILLLPEIDSPIDNPRQGKLF